LIALRDRMVDDPAANPDELRAVEERLEALRNEERREEMAQLGLRVPAGSASPPPAPQPGKNNSGKEYRGDDVNEVLRRAAEGQREDKRLARTLRNEIYENTDEAITTPMIDYVFRLMKVGKLGFDFATGKGWQEVAGRRSTIGPWINLHDLESRL
jgi:curved DNA-binding protein CbpA